MRHHFHLVSLALLAFTFLAQAGCTHRQLRYDHVMQARTITTIYEQQVLDNLAMFSQDTDSLPFFAVPGAGSATVTDNGSVSLSTLNGPARTIAGPLGLTRTNAQSWALTPITDAGVLRSMQVLYQNAVASGIATESSGRRRPVAECTLKGTHCGYSIQVCSQNRAAFSRLVLQVLETALGDPPATPEVMSDPTVEVRKFVYNEDSTVKEVQTYNVSSTSLGINDAVAVGGTGGGEGGTANSGSSSRNLSLPATSIERTKVNNVIRQQQQEILRGVLFPGQ